MRYNPQVLVAFIDSRTEISLETRTRWVNGVEMSERDSRVRYRWSVGRPKSIDLGTVDEFLMRHDLMLWEFEDWAGQRAFARQAPRPARRQAKGKAQAKSRPKAGQGGK